MLNAPPPMFEPNNIDWGSRPDVQNLLACLESGSANNFNFKGSASALIRTVGLLDVWPTESLRASKICTKNFEVLKSDLFKSIKSPDPAVACGGFVALAGYHTSEGFHSTKLSPIEVGEVYSEALRWSAQMNVKGIRNALSNICHCWMNIVEFQGAEIVIDQNTIKLSNDTVQGRQQDALIARRVLEGEGTLILGMSVGSSRFNSARTNDILEWLECVRPDSQLMITDRPARHNRHALGDTEDEALRYCLKKGRQLRGYATEKLNSPNCKMELFNWDMIYASPEFSKALTLLEELLDKSKKFHADVAAQTSKVLEREAKGAPLSDTQIRIGMNYLLEEFAAVMAVGEITKAPVAYAYYTDWQPFQALVNGVYDSIKRNLGFIKYELPSEEQPKNA